MNQTAAIVLYGAFVYGLWNVFKKTEWVPSWAALIPVYDVVQLVAITGKPFWHTLLMFTSVGIVPWALMNHALADRFNKSTRFALGLTLLPFIFYPLLGTGGDEYKP